MIDIFFDRFRNEVHLLLAACCKETWVAQLLPSLSVHISECGGRSDHGHGVDDGYEGNLVKVFLKSG